MDKNNERDHRQCVCWEITTSVWYVICNRSENHKSWVAQSLGMPVTFSPPTRVSNPDIHHGTCFSWTLYTLQRVLPLAAASVLPAIWEFRHSSNITPKYLHWDTIFNVDDPNWKECLVLGEDCCRRCTTGYLDGFTLSLHLLHQVSTVVNIACISSAVAAMKAISSA